MRKILFCFATVVIISSCSTHQKVVQVEPQVQEIPQEKEEVSLKRKVAIARFSNETQYAKGIFYEKENDPIGKQANDILSTKLAASGKFILLERENLENIENDLKMAGNDGYSKVGADYVIIGSVTEYGRKTIGDVNAFSRSKSQIVYAGVSVRLIDVSTGQIIYSEEAKGEAETTNKTVMGMGEHADYDASLNDKAISVAISKLVENIVNNCMNRPWRSYFLSYDSDAIIISGGASQGLKPGDTFDVVEKGKMVKNPQTGMMIELPGKMVGKIQVDMSGGDTPESEYSIVHFMNGSINAQALENYFIREIK